MFKRVERKRKKREEEKALGLDEETKEIFGMHDTDSDESVSDSETTGEDGNENVSAKDDAQNDSADEDIAQQLYPPIPLSVALLDPLYQISEEPPITGCLVCPGKILKSNDMFSQHKSSKAHGRRFNRFKSLSDGVDQDTNAWDIADKLNEGENPPAAPSSGPELPKKQARKRDFFKNRRAKRKAAAIAKQEAARSKTIDAKSAPASPFIEPARPAKKRKINDRTGTGKEATPGTQLKRSKPPPLDPKSRRPKHRKPQ
ncbi:hypothetical protein L218DRAFT_955097 [Marasmius fiardii PR-910]|nr:hypothetical protein L218DRAFT_955097 [Marasmius fiardii PR-910]